MKKFAELRMAGYRVDYSISGDQLVAQPEDQNFQAVYNEFTQPKGWFMANGIKWHQVQEMVVDKFLDFYFKLFTDEGVKYYVS